MKNVKRCDDCLWFELTANANPNSVCVKGEKPVFFSAKGEEEEWGYRKVNCKSFRFFEDEDLEEGTN